MGKLNFNVHVCRADSWYTFLSAIFFLFFGGSREKHLLSNDKLSSDLPAKLNMWSREGNTASFIWDSQSSIAKWHFIRRLITISAGSRIFRKHLWSTSILVIRKIRVMLTSCILFSKYYKHEESLNGMNISNTTLSQQSYFKWLCRSRCTAPHNSWLQNEIYLRLNETFILLISYDSESWNYSLFHIS